MPFSGSTSGAVIDQIVHSAPTSPVELNPELPRGLERSVNRCMEKKPEYWTTEFVLGDRTLDLGSALALLVDQTGRPGPSTREAGDHPDGRDDDPVTGISWYEAAAFAEFAGKNCRRSDTGVAPPGSSWEVPARGSLVLALEDRFGAAVLNVGGLAAYGRPRPEVDYLNCTPRITLPVLMLNGRYDLALLFDSEVQPMFALLGTPEEHKRLVVYETDHWIDRREVAKETLAWLDTYLGPVTTAR